MKKYIAIIAALTALVSCNDEFLDRMPEDTLTDANFWQTEAHVRSVAYSFTSSFMGKDWLNKTEIQADCNPWAVTTAWRTEVTSLQIFHSLTALGRMLTIA